jgi:uncharacterized protein (DUF952 family)/GNAT superfamily N-acetyltransferase
MRVILHLTNSANWIEAQKQGFITAPSLAAEGFIHCSTEHQMSDVANKYYRGATDMVLVHINPAALTSPLKWEPPAHIDGSPSLPDEPRFPHIYGVINLDAVIRVIDFPPNLDGSFDLPSQLTAFSVTHIKQVPHLHQQAAELSRDAWKIDFPEDTTQTYLDMFTVSGTYAGRFVEVFAAINQADELLGLATLVDDDGLPGATEPGPWLAAVFVVPEARKLGVGSALIDHVVNRSRELGYSEIFLYTDHQQQWYQKRGWTYTRDTLLNDMKHVVMRNSV